MFYFPVCLLVCRFVNPRAVKKPSGPVDRAIIFNPQFIHHSRPEMYKINVVQLLCHASATRVVLFSVPNRRLWLDVFVLLCACGVRTLFYTPVRPFVPLFQIHYRPMVTVQLRANFLSLALSLSHSPRCCAGKTTIKLHQDRV
jgi:hypothetical protein